MKRNALLLLLSILLGSLLLAACNTGPSGSEITGADRDAVMAYADPMTDNLLQGMVAGNYAAFSRDMNAKMLEAMTEKQFTDMKTKLDGQIGTYQSRTLSQVMDYGQVITVIYKGKFSKAPVNILVSFEKAEPHKITGLYFR